MDSNSEKQNEVFYIGPWTRSVESIVLSKFEEAMKCGLWVNGDRNSWERCATWVRKVMVKEEGVVISLNDYNLKIREWENRFRNFEFLIGCPRVTYNAKDNFVCASKPTWEMVLKVIWNSYIWWQNHIYFEMTILLSVLNIFCFDLMLIDYSRC